MNILKSIFPILQIIVSLCLYLQRISDVEKRDERDRQTEAARATMVRRSLRLLASDKAPEQNRYAAR